MVVQINNAMRKWTMVLMTISDEKQFIRLAPFTDDTPIEISQPVVYARLNLESNALYIGYTEHWENRVKKHYTATLKHESGYDKRCKGCHEHICYIRHNPIRAAAWIMIPLVQCKDKADAKQTETQYIKRLKPSINVADKPFWMLRKDRYANQKVHRPRVHRATPWSTLRAPKTTLTSKYLTTYETSTGETYRDLNKLIADLGCNKHTQVVVKPGIKDLTDWRKTRMMYGDSMVRWYDTNEVRYDTLLSWTTPHLPEITAFLDITVSEYVGMEHLQDIESLTSFLRDASDEELAFMWRIRNNPLLHTDFNSRRLVWDELQTRYPDLMKTPITLRIPFIEQLAIHEIKNQIKKILQDTGWPDYIVTWHMAKLKFVSTHAKTISEILNNVNMPWKPTGCNCAKIHDNLNKRGFCQRLPMIQDHIFFISRDYNGPNCATTMYGANNIPLQSNWDAHRAISDIWKQLPKQIRSPMKEWSKKPFVTPTNGKRLFVTTKEVFTLRKDLQGLVIGPVDKNLNELSFVCPVLYEQAWQTLYNEKTGYEKVYIRRDTPYNKRTYDTLISQKPVPQRSVGGPADLARMWQRIFKERQWNKFAKYDDSKFRKTGFNLPYILFKAKNITDVETRQTRWMKARPIAPQTKHPMNKFFHITGRAWSFLTANLPEPHFVIEHSGKVPNFLQNAVSALQNKGDIIYTIKDIEGCFPNMPKEAIKFGLLELTAQLRKAGHTEVIVPKKDSLKCTWTSRKKYGITRMPLQIMMDVIEFVLDNTFIKGLDGMLWQQKLGIPMGDPHSPGMTIGACAWMEQEWISSLSTEVRSSFRAARYMDDILMVVAKHGQFDHNRFLLDFQKSDCYWPPLTLEDAKEDTFLETTFRLQENNLRFWLKNENTMANPSKIWRYAHFYSYVTLEMKKKILKATLLKLHNMASDDGVLCESAIDKLHEFKRLGYPPSLIASACGILAARTRNTMWFRIRNSMVQMT